MDGQAEKNLLAAVLIQAVHDSRGNCPGLQLRYRTQIAKEARQWIASDRHDLGSFNWCCAELNLSASWLRRELLALVESGGRVTTTRARRMEQSGRSQHDGVPLGIYYQEQRYGGR